MTVRELYMKLSTLRTNIAEETGNDTHVVRILALSARGLDAVAVRYPKESMSDAIDELHDRSYEQWKEEQNANH